jgi:metallophosphoesterase superfamily enzyme
MKDFVRVVIPDTHGCHADQAALKAVLADIKSLTPKEVVLLGDHLDCGGVFSTHARSYTNELVESYQKDAEAANRLLDQVAKAAPLAAMHYLEGNHEARVERWAASTFLNKDDADTMLSVYGPAAVLHLKDRKIRYYKRSVMYGGLPVPGTLKLGRCYFVHGASASQHAAATHLRMFGGNIVFGHVHRSQAIISRSVSAYAYGAWTPGCLCKLQPLYQHTSPTSWSHGYGVQFVSSSGEFLHVNVPIYHGRSTLTAVLGKRR